ncbi:hypothetical protein [Aeromonas sp. HMWF014]|uniref:hypothetical protein n=1 Tax=Aeromonas sp. HMWF014 TaxID=2056850 RepID=UPI000D3C84BE|nr:hypothetical protein [Aeromonas sp. HMWF014]PTT45534.1 hypothetical protein DBR19_20720 [Aeromonas sp. HMWF014]
MTEMIDALRQAGSTEVLILIGVGVAVWALEVLKGKNYRYRFRFSLLQVVVVIGGLLLISGQWKAATTPSNDGVTWIKEAGEYGL